MDVSPSRSVRLKKGQRPHDSFLALVVKRLRAGTARNQILIRSHYAVPYAYLRLVVAAMTVKYGHIEAIGITAPV